MIAALAVILIFFAIVFALAWPLGKCIAIAIETPEQMAFLKPLRWIEDSCATVIGASYKTEMTWKEYFFALLTFHTMGMVLLFLLLRFQGILSFLDPKAVNFTAYAAFNTAVSFVTNTNWQSYVPETQMSWPVQMIGLTTQNFLSAAVGVTLLCAIARAFRRAETNKIGNFWQDLVRFAVYILLPLSLIMSIMLLATGVPQSAAGTISYTTLEGSPQTIPVGMCASQIAIKQLGTNGGGFFNVNSAHPFENPTIWSQLIELIAILLIPVALCRTFGQFVRSSRQGMLFVSVMGVLFIIAAVLGCLAEGQDIPFLPETHQSLFQPEGNMEGKECRFGPFWSVLWAVTTTATANGSVNSSLSSYLPLSGGIPLGLMQLGEVIFGGIGTGMTSAIVFLLIAVFAAGLMVGRTPEYLGKKIEAREMKPVALLAIFPGAVVLISTAFALLHPSGIEALSTRSPHGITEALYAFSSSAANNGSSFGGLSSDAPIYNVLTSIAMYVGRLFPAALILALAGALVEKKRVAETAGTLATDTMAFGIWFSFVIFIIGALNFLPVFTLGPIIEHMNLFFPG
jgi:potassium-transporting ATPase potassium-binding subunit